MGRLSSLLLVVCLACGDDGPAEAGAENPDGGGPLHGQGDGGGGGGGDGNGVVTDPSTVTTELLEAAFACDTSTPLRDVTATFGDPTHMRIADFNEDGKDDVMLGSQVSNSTTLEGHGVHLLLSSDDDYELKKKIGVPCAGTISECALEMAIGDHDGDGDPDLYVVDDTFNELEVWTNEGDGYFTQADETYALNDNMPEYRFYDVDSDGDDDLVLATGQTCAEPDDLAFFDLKECTDSAECGGDEVCRSSYYGSTERRCAARPCPGVIVMRNEGNGTFSAQAPQLIGTNDEIGVLASGDFNGDKKLDVIAWYDDVQWWRAAGANFAPARALSTSEFGPLLAFDLDNDGREELIHGSFVLWSDAQGTFQRATEHSHSTFVGRVSAWHLDANHSVVVSHGPVGSRGDEQGTISITVFEGATRKKHIDLCPPMTSDDTKGAAAVADLDGNGKRELLVAGNKKDVLQEVVGLVE